MATRREPASRRGTNASIASSGLRVPSGNGGTASRSGVRQPTKRVSTVRLPGAGYASSSAAAAAASRIGRAGAVSPAESLMSVATSATVTAGTKRKGRDDEGGTAADSGPVVVSLAEETNINVVVRCRGRNEREVRENSAVVVNTDGAQGRTVELMMGPNALSNKTYSFDRVFSPAADQGMIFDGVVKPILDDMLAGFNCTIFAYGQTGTGKTYTMSGDMSETLGLLTDAAGIIPRVLQSLFNRLGGEESDSIVRCSFIELYNEELRDLLSADGDGASKLKIYDDNSRRGHATTVVQGMEERHIASAADGIRRLQEGSLRRQVAATKCNDLSSRSHTVFTITVQTKHATEGGEDYFDTGKLNLVDLAGSENIQRSGAENKRAAEAGLINKSLLTLGRVINALVDRTAHVPYRESKLTRLLQDSLGGRTKTCIIATISTAKSNLEETISTLDYAFRAKNIRNKPQVNQLVNKKTLLRALTAELERLKTELIATRQRNGVYLSNDAYEEMTVQSESRRILAEEQAAKIETMEKNLRHKLQELLELTSHFMGLKKEHEGARQQLDETRTVLDETEHVLEATRQALAEETRVREAHASTEAALAAMGSDLMTTLARTVDDIDGLHAKNRRRSELHGANRQAWTGAQATVAEATERVEAHIQQLRTAHGQHVAEMARRMRQFVEAGQQSLASTQTVLDQNLAAFEASRSALLAQQGASKQQTDAVLDEMRGVRDHMQARVGESLAAIAAAAERIADDVLGELTTFHTQLDNSYHTLDTDMRATLDGVLTHLVSQKAESDRLRQQVEAAGEAAVAANRDVAAQIQEAVDEERRTAAEGRQRLLAQIGSLVAAEAEAQETRVAAKAEAIRARMAQADAALEGDVSAYGAGMDAWSTAADGMVLEATQARETLTARLEKDWTTADQHSQSIRTTTASVHATTVRVVEEQMEDLNAQMQDLDELVTRAAEHGDAALTQDATAVAAMAEVVTTAVADMSSHAHDAVGRAEAFVDEAEADVAALRDVVEPADATLCQPLRDLRATVADTVLRDYEPTGSTPAKVHYAYPRNVPRTAPRHVLLGGEGGGEETEAEDDADVDLLADVEDDHGDLEAKTDGGDDKGDDDENDDENDDDSLGDERLDTMPSPSKAPRRAAEVSVVFSDGETGDASQLGGVSTVGRSLREVSPNLAAAALDGGTSSRTASDSDGSSIGLLAASMEGAGESKDGTAVSSTAATTATTTTTATSCYKHHTLPMFRRSSRQPSGHSIHPPPTKQAKTRGSLAVALQGRENVPPAFSQSLSRRRSPRLN